MDVSLSSRFEGFLNELPEAECIDSTRPQSPNDPRRADFFLFNRQIVVELKQLIADQSHKGSREINTYLKDTGVQLFGEHSLSNIVTDELHHNPLEASVARRMTRFVESKFKDANDQIGHEFSRLDRLSTGLLVLTNESLTELHPRMVADRLIELARKRPSSVHYCLLIFESHRVRLGDIFQPYPLLLDLTVSARQRRARPLLKHVQDLWARKNGWPLGLPEPKELEYYPQSIILGG